MVICSICNNSGMVMKDDLPVSCECVKRKRIISLYKEVGLPIRFADIDLEQYNIKQDAHGKDISPQQEKKKITAKNVISSFINSLPEMIEGIPFTYENPAGQKISSFNLLISGAKHSGKSMLAACIVKGALRQNIGAYFLEWSEIINSCFDYYSDASAKNQTKIDKYERNIAIIESGRVVVIDNLDQSYENIKYDDDRLTANVRRQIDAMFSVRSKNGVPTIVATNQSLSELFGENKYGPVFTNILDDAIKVELPTLGNGGVNVKKVN